MKYSVQIREILAKEVTVEAESEDEALAKVSDMYLDGEIVLDYNDVVYDGAEGGDPETIGSEFADPVKIVEDEDDFLDDDLVDEDIGEDNEE